MESGAACAVGVGELRNPGRSEEPTAAQRDMQRFKIDKDHQERITQ